MGAGWSQEKDAKFQLQEPGAAIHDKDQEVASNHDKKINSAQFDDHHKTSKSRGDQVGRELVDKITFYVPAKELSITWSDDQRYWYWVSVKSPESMEEVEAAYLSKVCWLEVHGKFDTSKLRENTAYEVMFEVMLTDPAYGWEVPINLRLVGPNGKVQERTEKLMDIPRGRWVMLRAGEIPILSENRGGQVEYSLYEYGGKWKKGLLVKGAIIRLKI